MKNPLNKSDDTWCPIPWMGLSVRSVGDLRYCCHAHSSKGRGLLKNENDVVINLGEDKISEGVNATLLKEVRLEMLSGKRHPGCGRCYKEEDAGIHSRRMSEVEEWEDDISKESIINKTLEDGSIDPKQTPLWYLDLRFGNRCNLKCRMCGATESDRWYDVRWKLSGHGFFREGDRKLEIVRDDKGHLGLKIDPYKWYENESFWKDLESHLPTIKKIYLAGGEPLLIESQFDFLKLCIDRGYSKKITLEYNSNITALNQKILDLWSHFKQVEIGISVDGIGSVNDYIRTGSQWSGIEKNLENLDKAKGNYKLWWAATIQIYNMLHLPDMMSWIIEQNFQKINRSKRGREIFTPHPLSAPEQLSIKVFPEKSKKYILEYFEKEKSLIEEKVNDFDFVNYDLKERCVKRFKRVLDNYGKIMMSENNEHLKDEFWTLTRKLDEIHGTSFKDVDPLTYDLML